MKLARYKIQLRAKAEAVMPTFLGSVLRGAFGHSLKAISCSVSHGDCFRCPLAERCLYPRLFETVSRTAKHNSIATDRGANYSKADLSMQGGLLKLHQDAPRPFVFAPPLPATQTGFASGRDDFLRWRVRLNAGDSVLFGLTLIGSAIDELPYIIYAIGLMAQRGFGSARTPFGLEKVSALDPQGKRRTLYDGKPNKIPHHSDYHFTLDRLVEVRLEQLAIKHKDKLTLRFLTPTRLRLKGQVTENPTFVQLLRSISLRLSMLTQTWGDVALTHDYKTMIDQANTVSTLYSSLRLMALDRYSNRRKGKLSLDGFMGDITFTGGEISKLLPLLIAGEVLNVGSGTSFGLGRYVIVG